MSTIDGVSLPSGLTGSRFLLKVLRETAEAFPETFQNVSLPDSSKAFKRSYPHDMVDFESARLASPKRAEIATHIADMSAGLFEYDAGDRVPLADHMASYSDVELPDAKVTHFGASAGWQPAVPYRGTDYDGRAVRDLNTRLRQEGKISANAAQGVDWILDRIDANGGRLDLTGRRFVMLGAAAELAPTAKLLRAGATVLWVDLAEPEAALERHAPLETLSGEVHVVEGARNLLTEPKAIAAAVARFAGDDAVDIGLFAYAPGKGRELRLAGAMEAIVRALPKKTVGSVGLYISPTVVGQVQPGCREWTEQRKPRGWQKLLTTLRLLSPEGHVGEPARVARSVVSLQGPGYQAAQYLTKVCSAERWSVQEGGPSLSTNVAGITNTKSLSHPIFQVAFKGADSFNIQIFEPETTRPLSALIYLRDVLDPEAPGARGRSYSSEVERAAGALSQQVHGGVYTLPWHFEQAIRIATVIGATTNPGLVLRR